jgi:hypothetical protein
VKRDKVVRKPKVEMVEKIVQVPQPVFVEKIGERPWLVHYVNKVEVPEIHWGESLRARRAL